MYKSHLDGRLYSIFYDYTSKTLVLQDMAANTLAQTNISVFILDGLYWSIDDNLVVTLPTVYGFQLREAIDIESGFNILCNYTEEN